MRVGVIFVFMDFHRKGRKYRGALQPLIGPLVAALLPLGTDIDVINDTWEEPDWNRGYDLLFLTGMHSDFDRIRQISHYWRRRGAKTVFGGVMASTYPTLCQPFFDAVVVGDAEGSVPQIYQDFCRGELKNLYVSAAYNPAAVPVPRFDLLARKQQIPLSFEVTRGCPFVCEFCALTGIGTRHHVRPIDTVIRDIRAGQRMLRGLVPDFMRRIVGFLDNNIGGNIPYLRELCQALIPLELTWGAGITFNVVAEIEMVKLLSEAGCRALFMGLESLNPETIADMHKHQNSVGKTKRVLEQCRNNGILVESPLMVSPVTDTLDYIYSLPERVTECGLHQPTFLCIESPFPGTPHFHRLAAQPEPAFLPDAYLRDFTGYTLVTRPQRAPLPEFVEAYKGAVASTYTLRAKWARIKQNFPAYARGNYWFSAVADIKTHAFERYQPHPDRTYVAGTDVPPPEATSVPLTDSDFDSDEQRRAILEPWRVTDSAGRVLPIWQHSMKVFEAKGRIAEAARQLVAIA